MNNKIALICSLSFRAAHISHLVASYYQMKELGYESILYIHQDAIPFLPEGIRYVTDLTNLGKIELSIFWFPSVKNIKAMLSLRLRHKSKIIYVFHEPIEKFNSYLASGNSYWWTIKFYLKYYVGLLFLWLSDVILLPSKKALNLYQNGISHYFNHEYYYFPLMYSDERTEENVATKRKYISYIGGVSKDHAFDEYVSFIYNLYKRDPINGVKYLIASWRVVPRNEKINEMISNGILLVVDGKPMTNEEINNYYSSSLFVWNAYNRTTQSGVLAKAFMFGTPALIMAKNTSEFVQSGREVVSLSSNHEYEEILSGTRELIANNAIYSDNARRNYEHNFDYHCHINLMKTIIKKLFN